MTKAQLKNLISRINLISFTFKNEENFDESQSNTSCEEWPSILGEFQDLEHFPTKHPFGRKSSSCLNPYPGQLSVLIPPNYLLSETNLISTNCIDFSVKDNNLLRTSPGKTLYGQKNLECHAPNKKFENLDRRMFRSLFLFIQRAQEI
jgi:hypothetical protein